LIPPNVLRLRGGNHSLDTVSKGSADSDCEDFHSSNFEIKRNRRKERSRKTVIIGKLNDCGFKGAPEPGRDLFIFRVQSTTKDQELENHLKDNNFDIQMLKRVLQEDAKFKSFRLNVPKPQFSRLFDDSLWPSGVGIRKYVSPPQNNMVT
jgi:hypothetical protein